MNVSVGAIASDESHTEGTDGIKVHVEVVSS
jgi:hypothetical protein